MFSLRLLASEVHILSAWRRYESFWLPLMAMYTPSNTEPPLAPPTDVAMVWLAHLSSETYLQDISGICSAACQSKGWVHPRGMAPHYRRHSGPKDSAMMSHTEKRWKKEFGWKEPWAPEEFNLSANITAGVRPPQTWHAQHLRATNAALVPGPHPSDLKAS